jgi:hypothetical protein
MDAERCDEE